MLILIALVPLLAGLALPFLKIKRRAARMTYAVGATALTTLCLLPVLFGPENSRFELFRLSGAFVCAFRLDGAGRVFLSLAAFLWPIAVVYAAGYMKHERFENNFFGYYIMTYGVVILLAGAGNLFTLYICYELLTLFTLPLVWHEKDSPSIRAARSYFMYLFGGASLGFIAMILLGECASLPFAYGGVMASYSGDARWIGLIAVMAFLGFGVKAAPFPLCFWLPKASVAPTPVTALLHAVAVVNAGVFAVTRALYYVLGAQTLAGTSAQITMLLLSAFTIVYAAVMAAREPHVKRRLAWSTVSNLSYMLFGLSLLTDAGMAAALTHMVYHSLIKIILFYCAGAVMVMSGRAYARQLHGLAKVMPVSFAAFTFAGLALMGVPPLGGFYGKYALITAALSSGGWAQLIGCAALLISAVLTALYIFSVVAPAYFMKLNTSVATPEPGVGDPGWCMRGAILVLCVCLLIASLMPGRLMDALYALAR